MKINRKALQFTLSSSVIAIMVSAMPQFAAAQDAKKDENAKGETVVITGSSIKRKILDNALPIQIVTRAELERDGIVSAEQFIMTLSANGNGPENLASNADVVSGAQRGNNGVSSANLRGQGAAGTLVLFNGRRIAAHGLNGGAVDINQIPMAAIERIDVLKDGASAIYGTDAIGGVINYITKKSYEGAAIQAFADITEEGGSEIFRTSLVAGYGDLDTQKFNIWGTLSYSEHKALEGSDRDWVNGFQPNKGLSIDTRGTPFATIFPINASSVVAGGTLLGGTGSVASGVNKGVPFLPGSTTVRGNGGVNILDIPGGAGCDSIDGMQAYDHALWNAPGSAFACAWDTGRAVVLQQPIEKLNFVTRAMFKIGKHELSSELMYSDSTAAKRFSNPQFSSSSTVNAASNSNFFYQLNAITKPTYDALFNALSGINADWAAHLAPRYGLPIGYRWRCIECGQREIETNTKTGRIFIGLDGPLGSGWEYRTGASYSYSESSSLLGAGYYYRLSSTASAVGKTGIVDMLNKGNINPFLAAGQKQTQAALDDLASASAEGVTLYGGKYEVKQIDGSASGPLFDLPGGKAYAAVGFDLREEQYSFNGDTRTVQPEIFLAPFDNVNALTPKNRTINALYGELALPLFKDFELTLAVRRDEYSGFGSTTNPKVSVKYRPFQALMFRGSYNTGFRVPSFNQIFNGTTISPFPGATLADPGKCPGGLPNVAIIGCEVVNPDILSGGKLDLGPEEAEQKSFGFVYEFNNNYSLTLDWWNIERTSNIVALSVTQLRDNYSLFTDRFIRNPAGNLVQIDTRWANAGESITSGLEVGLRGKGEVFGGRWSAGMDGTYLLEKKSRLLPNAAWSKSEIGIFTLTGDLGLEWKHSAFVTFSKGKWSGTLSQLYRKGYTNGMLPGVANGTVNPPDVVKVVDDYLTHNMSVTYRGIKNFTVTAGVKNIFNVDPPFAITYDSNGGSGGNWEPRVADPRGRAFTLLLNYKF